MNFKKLKKSSEIKAGEILYYKFGHRIKELNMAQCKYICHVTDSRIRVHFIYDKKAVMVAPITHFFKNL